MEIGRWKKKWCNYHSKTYQTSATPLLFFFLFYVCAYSFLFLFSRLHYWCFLILILTSFTMHFPFSIHNRFMDAHVVTAAGKNSKDWQSLIPQILDTLWPIALPKVGGYIRDTLEKPRGSIAGKQPSGVGEISTWLVHEPHNTVPHCRAFEAE